MFTSIGTVRDWIDRTLKERFGTTGFVEVRDLVGTDDHFEAIVVSPEFEKQNMLAQHRMVYQTLGDAMKERIHALSIKTYAPHEWSQSREKAKG